MKKMLLIPFWIVMVTCPALGADTMAQQGLRLYQMHHYQEATHLLFDQLRNPPPIERDQLQLSFGMASLANARCYTQLFRAALRAQQDYLEHLVAPKPKRPHQIGSRMAALYLGKTYMASGNFKAAATWLERFLAAPNLPTHFRKEAQIALGTVYHKLADGRKARKLWSTVGQENIETMALLAAAYQQAGVADKQPAQMADRALSRMASDKGPLSLTTATALLGVFSQNTQITQGFDIIARTNLKAFNHEEILADNKHIRFYDPALLKYLAAFYNQTAIAALESAGRSAQPNIRSAGLYYLGEAFILLKQPQRAMDAFNQFLATHPKHKTLKGFAQVRLAALQIESNKQTSPQVTFNPLMETLKEPAVLSEAIMACTDLQIRCPQLVNGATTLWQQSPGRPSVPLSMALGRYYLQQDQYTEALTHLESSRDKSRKNRIEANAPMMLVDLARVYYQSKQFSEALEIYFEMSKQFPAVRQIQVAIQGVYAMEEQSAGDAKIF